MEDLAELHAKVEGCMVAAGQSSGCTPQLEWQGDHEIFDHDEYAKASRTCASLGTSPAAVTAAACSLHRTRSFAFGHRANAVIAWHNHVKLAMQCQN